MGAMCTTGVETLPDPKKVMSGTQMPEWVSTAGQQLYEQAAEMASSPYPEYTGQRIATYGDALDEEGNPIPVGIDQYGNPIYKQSKLTKEEQEAASLLSEGKDVYQDYLDDAKEMTDTLGQGYDSLTREELLGEDFDTEMASKYQDIYQTAIDPALAQLERDRQIQMKDIASKAARGGSFGGSRHGLLEATTGGEIARAGSDLRKQAGREALEFGAGRYDADRAARFAAEDSLRTGYETEEAGRLRASEQLQSFAPLSQGLQQQAAADLLTVGEGKRLLDQKALDMGYADYVEQREYPYQMLNFVLGALQGVPYETTQYGLEEGQQYVQSPSVYGQTLGGAGALASAYYMGKD
jgi:hypothetical protein